MGPPALKGRCTAPVPGGCGRKAYLRGLCSGHYQRSRTGEPLDTPLRPRGAKPGPAPRPAQARPRDPGRCDRCGCRLRETNRSRLCWPCAYRPLGKAAPTDEDLARGDRMRKKRSEDAH